MTRVRTADGTDLYVEDGPEGAPVLLLTHGWGAAASEWAPLRRALAVLHRVVAWDLPGLGRSSEPPDDSYSMEHLARCLDAVLARVGRPAYLVGHSIGGVITLTHAKLFPKALGDARRARRTSWRARRLDGTRRTRTRATRGRDAGAQGRDARPAG